MLPTGAAAQPSIWPWIATAGFGLSLASIFPSILTHAERSFRVSGRIASLCVSLTLTLTPTLTERSFRVSGRIASLFVLAAAVHAIGLHANARVAAPCAACLHANEPHLSRE